MFREHEDLQLRSVGLEQLTANGVLAFLERLVA